MNRGEKIFPDFKIRKFMKVEKKDLQKSQLELNVEITWDEFKPFIKKAVEQISKETQIQGFRPGKAPYEVVKQKIGEMGILEQAARLAINKTLDEVIVKNTNKRAIGQPEVSIIKLAADNPFVYKVIVSLLPEIVLGEYKGLKIKQKKEEIKPKEIDKIIENLREARVQEILVNRAIKNGDKALVDIKMFLDKVPLEGGQSKDTSVLLGKNYIVPGFDRQLLGLKKGDKKTFLLPYPKDHFMKNIAGKMVEFKVLIKGVYERKLPDLDDKFAQDYGLKDIEELKKNVTKSVKMEKEREAATKAEKEMLEKLVNKAKFGDLPEFLVKHEGEVMMHELEHAVEEQGGKFSDYLASLKKTKDELALDMLPQAVQRVKVSLLIREIAKKEKITISKEMVDENIKRLAQQFKNDKENLQKIHSPEYRDYTVNVLTSRKTVDKLRKWNIEIEK